MKYIYSLFLCFAFLLTQNVIAQDCHGSLKPYYLNGNNIKASFFPRGNKFYNGHSGDFLVPFPSEKKLSTIFASSVWIGGFDDAGNFKYAAETFPSANPQNSDYSVGPLSSIGTLYDSTCTHYDRAWTVYGEDIRAHRSDFWEDFKIDDTIDAIFQWPARGNKHFIKYFGFELPFDNYGLAPFHDANSNNIYDPEKGDYPIVFPTHSHEYIPDQILWMVFNDLSSNDEDPLRFEIQLTAFAYHCTDNKWLNNTIFNRYRIINRAVTSIDSTFFGMWTDYDLGCYADDFIGSDPVRNTEFVYNDTNGDGSPGFECFQDVDTYGANPPVQSMTYLSHPMHSFINAQGPDSTITFYRKLNGQWNDGSPIYPAGEGYDPGSSLQPTRFLYSGDPRDPNSWSANNVLSEGKEYRTVSSIKLGRMDPGSRKDVILAYQFHHHPDSNYNGQLSLMYNNVDSLLNIYYPGEDCTPFPYCADGDCVWPGDFNHDGIADHYDLLPWGVMNNSTGPERNGLVSWRGHYGKKWVETTPANINYKHGDANGDGTINQTDLEYNVDHFGFTNPSYIPEANYPYGPELLITSDKLDVEGKIKNLRVSTNLSIENVLGLAFELEFDTVLFRNNNFWGSWPSDSNSLLYNSYYGDPPEIFFMHRRFAAVQTDNKAITLPSNKTLMTSFGATSLVLNPGLTVDDIPDTIKIRLKNLIAIDAEGNDLHVGANELFLLKSEITSTAQPEEEKIYIYPNPANDIVQITGAPDFDLIDPQGRVLQIFINNSGEINVSEYSPGVYFLRIADNNTLYKLIIQ